jgi:heterodisulfide reductase subunit A
MEEVRIGVYICHCGTNIAGTVDVEEVRKFAEGLPDVVVARDYKYMCSDPGQALIKEDIANHRLNRVVVAACSPRMHEPTFRRVLAEGGLNPYLLEMVNIREHNSWVHLEGTVEKAKALVSAGVSKVRFHRPLETKRLPITKAALVVGGGVAGIQAALEIANAGVPVYLVEKEPSIGGHMIMLDKTFPTLDCSACILTPKMSEVGSHPHITLLTYSQVEEVSGSIGQFKVKVRKKARYVDEDKCVGCGICVEKCPRKVPSEFDQGLGVRKAIYIPFPQAVPNVPVIDRDLCQWFQKGRCQNCLKNCDRGAVNFEQQDQILELEVGFIVVATGYDLLDLAVLPRYGYRKYPNVYTSLEFERLVNASGPTGGKIVLRDGREPESVAIIHCVGSRDKHYAEYCSRVCCMYALKFSHLIKEKTEADVYHFYIDMRCFGKGFEEFYARVEKEGAKFIRGKVAAVTDRAASEEEEGKLVVIAEDSLIGKRLRVPVDMVVLCPAMVPQKDAAEVARTFLLSQGRDGFFIERHPKLDPVATPSDGVFVVGCCQGPKDIPDTVAQASAAAARVLSLVQRGEVEIEPITSWVQEERCSGCRICVDLCPYKAISFDEEKKVSRINEALCKGCGTCAVACPMGAIIANHFATEAILAQVEGVLV